MDKERLKARITELRTSLDTALQQRQALEDKARELDATMMRIRGAIQVLEELLVEQQEQGSGSLA